MSETRITVDNGKYIFINPDDDWRVNVLRHGEPWVRIEQGSKAILALMFLTDEFRIALTAAAAADCSCVPGSASCAACICKKALEECD